MPQTEAPSITHQIDPASLDALPRTSGVYIFKGEGTLPLYIGKSVDIRSRVLAHLRAEDEAEMIAQSRKVNYAINHLYCNIQPNLRIDLLADSQAELAKLEVSNA